MFYRGTDQFNTKSLTLDGCFTTRPDLVIIWLPAWLLRTAGGLTEPGCPGGTGESRGEGVDELTS